MFVNLLAHYIPAAYTVVCTYSLYHERAPLFESQMRGVPVAKTIKASFDGYKTKLEITDRQTALVSTRRTNVVNALKKELTLHTISPSLLIGSYDRNTMTRYLKEADIDVMVVMNYGTHKE